MDLSMRADDLGARFSILGAALGFVLGLAGSLVWTSLKGSLTAGQFFGIWAAAVALGTGGGAALGVGLAIVGTH
jgi:hypothetical protein